MKTALYLRQSLDRDKSNAAVDRQRAACLDLCRRRGWTDTVEYCDNDKSASKGIRPDYQQMLADIDSGAVNAVVVYHLDRLHRQPRELEYFIDLTTMRKVALATVTGDIDLATDDGRCMARVMGAFARKEVERKSARQKLANEQRAKEGKAWMSRPFGYTMKVDKDAAVARAEKLAFNKAKGEDKTDAQAKAIAAAAGKARADAWSRVTDSTDNKLVKREADAIRDACGDLLNGVSLFSIAAQWNSHGLKTVNDNDWTGGTVRQVLLRPRNAGLQVRGTRAASAASKIHETIVTDAEGNPVKTSWPAIISRDAWQDVCKLLADPKRHTGRSPGRKHLLTGIARCGVCGGALNSGTRGVKSGGRKPVYQCKHKGCGKILRDLVKVDQRVVEVVTRRLSRPDAVASLFTPTVDTAAIRDEINRLQAQIAAANAEYDDGIIDGRRLQGRIDRVNAKLGPLQDKLLDVHMSRDVKELAGKPNARERFDRLPLDRRRGVVDTLAVVTVHPQVKGGRFDPASVTVDWK